MDIITRQRTIDELPATEESIRDLLSAIGEALDEDCSIPRSACARAWPF